MGRKPLTDEQRQQMRERILGAARESFLAGGFGSLSMRDIASKVGISAMTIYLYFKNRQDIIFALVREGIELLEGALQQDQEVTDPLARLISIGHAYVQFAYDQPQYYRALFQTRPEPSAQTGEMAGYSALLDDVSRVVKPILRAVSDVTNDPAGAVNIATALWCSIHGFVSLSLNDRLRFLRVSHEQVNQLLNELLPKMLVSAGVAIATPPTPKTTQN